MRRDVDLERQLLLDVEAHGAECPVAALTGDATEPAHERVRHHVRLLIDAGLLKDVDHKSSAVRLTSAGHELLELARSDVRWREAKYFVRETTGGLSLTVLRAVLTKWAVESASRLERRPRRRVYRPVYAYDAPRRPWGYYGDRDSVLSDDRAGFVRTWPDYRERSERGERFEWRDPAERDDYYRYTEACDGPPEPEAPNVGVSLPIYMV